MFVRKSNKGKKLKKQAHEDKFNIEHNYCITYLTFKASYIYTSR